MACWVGTPGLARSGVEQVSLNSVPSAYASGSQTAPEPDFCMSGNFDSLALMLPLLAACSAASTSRSSGGLFCLIT